MTFTRLEKQEIYYKSVICQHEQENNGSDLALGERDEDGNGGGMGCAWDLSIDQSLETYRFACNVFFSLLLWVVSLKSAYKKEEPLWNLLMEMNWYLILVIRDFLVLCLPWEEEWRRLKNLDGAFPSFSPYALFLLWHLRIKLCHCSCLFWGRERKNLAAMYLSNFRTVKCVKKPQLACSAFMTDCFHLTSVPKFWWNWQLTSVELINAFLLLLGQRVWD